MAKGKIKRIKGKQVRQPATLDWDFGATGPANQQGLVKERLADIDGTGTIKRARRVDMLEVWHKRGWLSAEAWDMAKKLRDAFEGTQRTLGADYERPRVDSSPKPDCAVDIQIDRLSRYRAMTSHVADGDRDLVIHCVINGKAPHGRGAAEVRAGVLGLSQALERANQSMNAPRPRNIAETC
ncbi:hypothetical protein [Ketogulonicigenium vulgare]|uniref:hypothetical protein n=1 Tax=Ketogulonicigenium vulgare TaxID=92945 RepID=UPI0023587430|nr:hypothetical protein [Ketogulonicigenium vulgare]